MLTMHPDDMARRDLSPGAYARIRSRRGSIVLRVEPSFDMQRGQVFVPMHFGASHLSHAGVNALCLSAFDPYSKQPELKHAAVQVELCVLPWKVVALRRAPPEVEGDEQALRWIQALRPLLRDFDYAYVSLTGRREAAATLRVAHREPLSASQMDALDVALDLVSERCSLYEDRRRGISKRAWVEGDRLLGFRLAGEVSASDWLADTLTEGRPASVSRRWMLGPFSAPPLATALPATGRIVCNCHGVGATPILECIGRGGDLDALQRELRCGTDCGSCLPELRRMMGQTAATT
jgi:assimilatory nitrate reductase catalytic subunit